MMRQVTKAIEEAHKLTGGADLDYVKLAEAAIEAMRDPTGEMINAAFAGMVEDDPVETYRNIIKSALGEPI